MQRTLEDRHVFADSFVENGGDVEALLSQVENLKSGLTEIERRLREDTVPVLNLINKTLASPDYLDDEKLTLSHAWKWAIYGAAIHAQIALMWQKVEEIEEVR
jgi:hypothetical protein